MQEREMFEVKVFEFNDMEVKDFEKELASYINKGYAIQSDKYTFKQKDIKDYGICTLLTGVYVLIKEKYQ